LKDIVDHQESRDRPTYFELCTALMFLYCDKRKVDYAIIEVGLGGRYDATNVINPILTVITNISFDHMDILGETIEQIAFEKAGIIKDCVPLITAAEGNALSVIEKEVKAHHSTMVLVPDSKSSIIENTSNYQLIRIQGMLDEYMLKTYEIGSYQRNNLALTLYTVEQLQMMGVFISPESISDGVEQMQHQGRMKIIHTDPIVIIDGAHNPSGIHEVKTTMLSLYPKKNIILIFGVLKDKNIKEMIKEIHSLCQMMIITLPSSNRAADPNMVKNIATSFFSNEQILVTQTVTDAINKGLDIIKKDDILLITGSLYLIGEIITYFKRIKTPDSKWLK
jgi:dihydrofolate synthase / folylpolyglutamate synthase